jgi:hypothetical protein
VINHVGSEEIDWATVLDPAYRPPAPKPPAPPPLEEPPPRMMTADEIVAAQRAKVDEPPDQSRAAPDIFRPLSSLPVAGGATGPTPRLGQHQTTARTEIVELRREVAEMMRVVKEIHARVVMGGK